MRTLAAWSMLVVAPFTIMFAAGCRDEVAVTLDEIETVQQKILALLEQQAQTTAVPAAAVDRPGECSYGFGKRRIGLGKTTRAGASGGTKPGPYRVGTACSGLGTPFVRRGVRQDGKCAVRMPDTKTPKGR